MATVAASFTATGVGAGLFVRSGDRFSYSLSGTYDATLVLEYSVDGGMSWTVLRTEDTEDGSVSGEHLLELRGGGHAVVRWRCAAFTSGTAVTSLADVAKVLNEVKDEGGRTVFKVTEDGVEVAGTLTATGEINGGAESSNVGTAGTGVTAAEAGDARTHVTTLTLDTTLPAIAGGADLGVGKLVYTFPAGAIIVESAYMSVAIQQTEDNITADTPEVGLGTTIASGAVAVLSGTAAFENIITGQVAADCDGTATVKTAIPTAGVPLVIEAGDAHTVHVNVADGWAADGDAAAGLTGTVVLNWRFVA